MVKQQALNRKFHTFSFRTQVLNYPIRKWSLSLFFPKKVIPSGYRKIALIHGCTPTEKTSDKKIIEIYSKVLTAFQQAAKQRGTRIPALNLNFIALKFLQIYEIMGEAVFDSHLQYETEKYLSEGLRPEYKQELNLF